MPISDFGLSLPVEKSELKKFLAWLKTEYYITDYDGCNTIDTEEEIIDNYILATQQKEEN